MRHFEPPSQQTKFGLTLCWIGRIIYIKPLPNYLLGAAYVNEHVWPLNAITEIDKTALGFLRSYCMSILTLLDLQTKRLGLIDERMKWANWHADSEYALPLRRVHREYMTYFGEYFQIPIHRRLCVCDDAAAGHAGGASSA
ncbi:hypothetical protein K449DRAFT_401679 [Hypoxylon sp. EC38]|nr:hypothetical protein K449DRAFT_401679 [Hypoxylon sp. EC38]